MATETEMTSAREPGQAPVLVTRLGGQQRIFPAGAQVRMGRDPTLELVSVNPLVSRQCHGVITSDQGGATYVDQSRRGTLGVAVAAVAGLATYGFFALRPAGGGLSGGQRAAVLRHAEAATVRLLMGSEADASPVVARYRARTVAVDGYLDLAVVQVYATASGRPVRPGSLHLPYLTVGNVAALQLDQNVTTLGFPGMSGSDSITVTSGVVDTLVPDPLKHVKDPRFELETTAKIGHGNSGGAAITDSGQLIGVPSLGLSGQGSDVSWRLRSHAREEQSG